MLHRAAGHSVRVKERGILAQMILIEHSNSGNKNSRHTTARLCVQLCGRSIYMLGFSAPVPSARLPCRAHLDTAFARRFRNAVPTLPPGSSGRHPCSPPNNVFAEVPQSVRNQSGISRGNRPPAVARLPDRERDEEQCRPHCVARLVPAGPPHLSSVEAGSSDGFVEISSMIAFQQVRSRIFMLTTVATSRKAFWLCRSSL